MSKEDDYVRGRGSQIQVNNKFEQLKYGHFEEDSLDDLEDSSNRTQFYNDHPKKIVNKVKSPDIGMAYSMNPYQGCEHGCTYCYARNSHEYWGFGAGLDFERKIIIKENAAEVLAKQLSSKNWVAKPIMLSGNTDCYQPIEKKKEITRAMLKVLLKYKHPVGIITKNDLILRDLDLLQELNAHNLVNVNISLTSLDEKLRRSLEPRTSASKRRLNAIAQLSSNNIPVNVMVAPVIPALNSMEIPQILEASALNGARTAAYTMVRLNGAIASIFADWVEKNYADRAEKVLHQIAECHSGKLSDSRFGKRMRGEGNVAKAINRLFIISKHKYFGNAKMPQLNTEAFYQNRDNQLKLF